MAGALNILRKRLSAEEWDEIASLSGTTKPYLNQIALGFRRPSITLAIRIFEAIQKVSPDSSITKESLVFTPLRRNQ